VIPLLDAPSPIQKTLTEIDGLFGTTTGKQSLEEKGVHG
jgi:hypothetical protein